MRPPSSKRSVTTGTSSTLSGSGCSAPCSCSRDRVPRLLAASPSELRAPRVGEFCRRVPARRRTWRCLAGRSHKRGQRCHSYEPGQPDNRESAWPRPHLVRAELLQLPRHRRRGRQPRTAASRRRRRDSGPLALQRVDAARRADGRARTQTGKVRPGRGPRHRAVRDVLGSVVRQSGSSFRNRNRTCECGRRLQPVRPQLRALPHDHRCGRRSCRGHPGATAARGDQDDGLGSGPDRARQHAALRTRDAFAFAGRRHRRLCRERHPASL